MQSRVHLSCAATLAHELGHVYMHLSGFDLDAPPKLAEGLCELFSYVWITAGFPQAKQSAAKRQPPAPARAAPGAAKRLHCRRWAMRGRAANKYLRPNGGRQSVAPS